MMDGGDPTTPVRTSLQQVLAEQANQAISQGADPKAVTARLGQMVAHLKAHPELDRQGMDAIGQGADAGAVTSRMWQLAQQGSAPQPEQPGLLTRSATMLGNTVSQMVRHPIDTAVGMVKQAGNDLVGTFLTPVEGARNEPDPKTGLLPYPNLPVGATVSRQNTPNAISQKEQALSGLRTTANAAFAPVAGGIAGKLGGGALAKTIGLATAGAGAGAAYSPDDPAAGAITGGLLAPLVHGATKAGGAALGATGSTLLDVVGRPADTRAITLGPLKIGTIQGVADRARTIVGKRAAMDRAAGARPNVPANPTVPPLAIDQGGPNVQGYAEGIANRPGPGRAIITQAVEGRQAQMRPNVEQAFDYGTQTSPEDGMVLLNRLAEEEQQVEAGTQAAKEAAKAKPYQADPITAWKTTAPSLRSGVRALQAFVKARGEEAKQLYGAARRATAGQPVESPTLESILKTPIGQAARKWAEANMGNMDKSFPTVQTPDGATTRQLIDMGVPADKAASVAGTVETRVPDPEALHLMKRFLAAKAKLGNPSDPTGTIAAEAQGALNQWGKIREELPDVWRQADDAYSAKSRVIDALNQGRDLMRTQLNPPGMKALKTSLDAVEQSVGKMSPQEQQAFRLGAQSAITDHLRSGAVSNKALMAQLLDPQSALSRKIALATGDKTAPAQFAKYLAPQTFAPPEPPTLSPAMRGAKRGLGILGTLTSSTDPEKTLPVLQADKTTMGPAERAGLQRGSAQALRGEFAGSSAKSPGRVFASSPERVAQTREAFPTPERAAEFQNAVAAWDAAQEQAQKLLGNSRTGLRGAEGSGAMSKPSALFAGTKQLVKNIVDKAGAKLQTANQQAVEAEAARLLVSPELKRLPPAARANLIRQGILRAAGQISLTGALTSGGQR